MPTLTLADPCLVLLVGAAGSGKSTLARRWFAADEILSSDALRAAVSGSEADQSASRVAFAILHGEVVRRLTAGRLTVVDATNVRAEHRRPLQARARAAGVPMAAIVLDLAPAVLLARDAGRRRVVGPEVIGRQLGHLRRTLERDELAREGVAEVVILRTPIEVDALEVIRLPRVSRSG